MRDPGAGRVLMRGVITVCPESPADDPAPIGFVIKEGGGGDVSICCTVPTSAGVATLCFPGVVAVREVLADFVAAVLAA